VVDALHSAGVSSTDIFDVAGITPLEQNAWKTQAAVFVSLEAAPDFPKELLPHFRDEGHAASLSELRVRPARGASRCCVRRRAHTRTLAHAAALVHFLTHAPSLRAPHAQNTPVSWRPAAARLVAERSFGVDATRELARASIDYERRPDPSRSFEPTPGDALAYKVWRDAGEVPRRAGWREGVEACVARGLTFATSEGAKARLRSRLEEDARALIGGAGGAGAGSTRVSASVQVVRLETEEAAFRALPLVRAPFPTCIDSLRARTRAMRNSFCTFPPIPPSFERFFRALPRSWAC
jgi:hypothetical protein